MTAAKKKTESGKTKTEQSFEKSLERLETIVEEMEGGDLSLEQMMSHFEEGQKLVKLCSGKLNEVERKIELLVKKGEKVTTEPFEEGEDEGAEEAVGETEEELF